jgi:hypothetical protein
MTDDVAKIAAGACSAKEHRFWGWVWTILGLGTLFLSKRTEVAVWAAMYGSMRFSLADVLDAIAVRNHLAGESE